METETNKSKRPGKAVFIIIPVALVALTWIGIRVAHGFKYESTDNAAVESFTFPVIARVAGFVDSVYVNDYALVSKDSKVMTIDNREYKIAQEQAEADYQQALADLENAKASLENAKWSLRLSQTNAETQQVRLNKAQSDYRRDQNLYKDGSITPRQFEDSKNNLETVQKQYQSATEQTSLSNAQLRSGQAQIRKAEAMANTRKAMLESADLKLTYTTLVARSGGRVGKINIEPGQFVQAGQTLFSIVNNEQFWVIANFKETQIAHLKQGQEVNIYADSYPDEKIRGRIVSMSEATGSRFALLPPDNATGNFVKVTQRIPVRIEIDDLAKYKDILKAGMSVKVDVKVAN